MSSELKVHVSVSVTEQEIQQLPPDILRCLFFPLKECQWVGFKKKRKTVKISINYSLVSNSPRSATEVYQEIM